MLLFTILDDRDALSIVLNKALCYAVAPGIIHSRRHHGKRTDHASQQGGSHTGGGIYRSFAELRPPIESADNSAQIASTEATAKSGVPLCH